MRRLFCALMTLLAPLLVCAQTPTFADVAYAQVGGTTLRLDLYLPAATGTTAPVLVWIHGGGWCSGGRSPLAAYARPLVGQGVAVVAVSYRLTSSVPNCSNSAGSIWPAQIHDLKGAVRWLRANAALYNLDPSRIAVWGQSAGAHVASILALSSGVAELEGNVGGNLGQSSAVLAGIAFFPPTDLLQLGPDFALTPPNRPDLVTPADGPATPHSILIGFGAAGEGIGVLRANLSNPASPWPARVALAQSANPVNFVDAADPPMFLAHGTADITVPINQSRRLRDALVSAGVLHSYREVVGFGHTVLDAASEQAARDWLLSRLDGDRVFADAFEGAP